LITCSYCEQYRYLEKRKEDKVYFRVCTFNPKKKGEYLIISDSIHCEKFILADYFFCEKYDHQTSVDMCRSRVRNEKNFDQWKYCEKCRQYRKTICLLVRLQKKEKAPDPEIEKPKLKLKRRKPKLKRRKIKQKLKRRKPYVRRK